MERVYKEKLVKKKVKEILKEVGGWWFMPAGTGFGVSGILDFIGCYRGQLVGIECKSGDNTPTALQLKCMKDIEEAGGRATVINELNIQQLKEWIINGQQKRITISTD